MIPVSAISALMVTFKFPISEISEIDDHKSVLKNVLKVAIVYVYIIPNKIVTIRLGYKLRWKESRMLLNRTADWSRGQTLLLTSDQSHHHTPV